MNNDLLEENLILQNKLKSPELFMEKEKSLEKGSIEHLLSDSFDKKLKENPEKELHQLLNEDHKSIDNFDNEKETEINDKNNPNYSKYNSKNFNFETLNRDLADIEERLRATRLSWNKSGKPLSNESNDTNCNPKDVMRKSWSLLDIDKRPYSNGSSLNELDGRKRHSGENIACDSPALSESLLKWDYGADIGLTQDDSDDMEPITWPVTAEQAQRDAHSTELGGMSRRMKISLSQGSFLSSPDPEDRQNLIAKISAEYKSNKSSNVNLNNKLTSGSDIVVLSNGIYDDKSARQIMEQAEAAEKRLRQRLEAVKALHGNEKSKNSNNQIETQLDDSTGIPNDSRSPVYSESPMTRDVCFNKMSTNTNFKSGNVKNQQTKLGEENISGIPKQNSGDDECKSPTSVSNTGRTTTMESTHTSSDYGKAPVFTGDAYGSRKDIYSSEHTFGMYSKHNRESSNDLVKTFDVKEMKNFRQICGIPPDLDTISSRETLQMTDDKKDDVSNSPLNKKVSENSSTLKEVKNKDDLSDHLSDKDISQEHSLQAKWNQFKTMMKEDEYNLFDKTNFRSAVQYNHVPNIKINENGSTYRQQSSATTFTTITNISPRHESFTTEALKMPYKENQGNEYKSTSRKTGTEDNKTKPSNEKVTREKHYRTDNGRYGSSQYLDSRSRPTKKLTGGGGGRDNDDNEDELSQTERRKLRHAAELAKFKKRYGSGALDGETTASELEHDDHSKFKRTLVDKTTRKKQLSQMLTDISKQGVAEDSMGDLTDVSQSSSVDTMLLMNKMSHLLKKKHSDNLPKRSSNKYSVEKSYRNSIVNSNGRDKSKVNNNRIIESDDAKLVLKHLMLKQKVKWLADCAREEARRRKIRKIEKLMDLYEQGNSIIIPDGLETETATLIGSNRESQEDLCSQTDSFSFFDNETINPDFQLSSNVVIESCESNKKQKAFAKSPSFGKQFQSSKENYPGSRKENVSKKKKKTYPASKAWNIPMRDSISQDQGDLNDSNAYNYESPVEYENNNRREYQTQYLNNKSHNFHKSVNLTTKERFQLRRDLELARQRNAHECQKDIRQSKFRSTKVTTGGLSWDIGLEEKKNHRKSNICNRENLKDKNNEKSELQAAFENQMAQFISKSRQRQKRIKLAVDERRYESQMNMERTKLFVSNNETCGPKRRRPFTQPDPLSAETAVNVTPKVINKPPSQNIRKSSKSEKLYKPQRRRFSKSEMKTQSALKYQSLPEVQAKYLDERRKAKMQSNRMKMHLYGEKILQSLLRNRGPWISNHN